MKPETIVQPVLEFDVGAYGQFLATRSSADAVRRALERHIDRHEADHQVIISFTGVEAMTISFADEFLGKFYSALAAGDVMAAGVRLWGFNEETQEAASICLERRDLVGVMIEGPYAGLIGKTEALQASFQTALDLGEFRAVDLAAALSITPQNANNRLVRLVKAGAVQRRQALVANRGGKEFVYSVATVRLPCSTGRDDQ